MNRGTSTLTGHVARVALVFLAGVPSAWAGEPDGGIRLVFVREPGAESCPDEQEFRDALAAQMNGTDPFVAGGKRRILITLKRQGSGFRGEGELFDAAGASQGAREFERRSCGRLVEDLAISLSLVLQPVTALPGIPPLVPTVADAQSAPPPPPMLAAPQAAPAQVPLPPAATEGSSPRKQPTPAQRPHIQLGIGAMVGAGTLPAPALGLAGLIGIRWPSISLTIEVRGDLPVTLRVSARDQVRSTLLAGAIAPCWHRSWFMGCGLLVVGAIRQAETEAPHEARTSPHGALGARAGLSIPFGPARRFAAQLVGDGLIHLTRARLTFDDRQIWRAPPVAGALGGRVLVGF